MAGADDDVITDPLTAAVVEAARHAARGEWGGPPQLYALATRASLEPSSAVLPASVSHATPDRLIPIEQRPLPDGDPAQVLAGIYWPPSVPGCVLVTEVVIEDDAPAGGGPETERQARLTVGVLRDGDTAARYACCLQRRGSDQLIIEPGIADDVVAALLGTLLTASAVPART